MNTTQIPPDTHQTSPRHPPRYLQLAQDANKRQQTPTDIARHTQTAPVNVLGRLKLSLCVCWRLLLSIGVLCSQEISLGCLGGDPRCIWGYLSGNFGNGRRSDVFWGYLASQSLQYGAVTLFWHSLERTIFFSSDHAETSKYQNVHMSAQQKWLGLAIFQFFKACQREIIIYSCY